MENELIKVTTNEQGVQCVSARELHEGLRVTERFQQWFDKRVSKYDFIENEDFTSVKNFTLVNNGAIRELQDYVISIDMAKELCMVQNNEQGKKIRRYFIECEKKLKTLVPQISEREQLLLKLFSKDETEVATAHKKLVELETKPLLETIEEQQPKVEYVDKFMNSEGLFLISEVAKKVGITAKRANEILKEQKIIYKNGKKHYPYAKTPKAWYGYQESIGKDGTVYSQLKWTSKGVYEITKILEDNKD